ncbi:S1 RNA-binding domain-containing protein 1 [Liparis tanakae]|uniref:S1 RNA-binding domain-containing protein 1 n=1 Tax=Liparis tanakae TaxID=230148 RepID=A0A4Z2F181_9TELE|nr:S1 RNA-binding domain-containing protein 1 [Liparis tanakae]
MTRVPISLIATDADFSQRTVQSVVTFPPSPTPFLFSLLSYSIPQLLHPSGLSSSLQSSFLSLVGGSADQIGSAGLQQCVESKVGSSSVENLAETLGTAPETLQLIIDGLTQPPGFDIRQNFGQADFKRGIVSMSDLRVGAVLTGRVDNTALFGAFVDIGVGRAGLIHKSNITLNKLPADQRRRSLALGPGERVEVRVLNVDQERGRISLDLIRILQ